MLKVVQVINIFLVSIAWAQALAHALELPGKLRLDKKYYVATQSIYYPGFTIAAGFGEGLGMVSTLALLVMTGSAAPEFVWTAIALAALVGMHAVYWLVTHAVNRFWVMDLRMAGAGARFFDIGDKGEPDQAGDLDANWTRLRDRWEYSHVARAILAGIALIALAIAAAI